MHSLLGNRRRLLIALFVLVFPSVFLVGSFWAATGDVAYKLPVALVNFAQSSYSVHAGKTATITVVLSVPATEAVTVAYATSPGTAESPGDYTSASGTLTFAPGETAQQFTVTTVDAGGSETGKTILLALSGPTNAQLGTPATARLTLKRRHVPPAQLWITAAGDHIVPGSSLNAVRYRWSAGATPSSVSLKVVNGLGAVVRRLEDLPTAYVAGKNYAEALWNGCRDEAGTELLTQEHSPYQLELKAEFGSSPVVASPRTALVKKWYYHIGIGDRASSSSPLLTGPDINSINVDTLEIRIKVDGGSEVTPLFSVKNGPVTASGNGAATQYGCLVTPHYLFYTTPKSPYNIRYSVVIEQKNRGGDGELITVMDAVGNPWDMDPTQPGRQMKGTRSFGVDTAAGTPPRASLRQFRETYE